MRLWKNGRRLGVIAAPLIEEVPVTLAHGITQQKRWVCRFLQSVGTPLERMGFTWRQRMRAGLVRGRLVREERWPTRTRPESQMGGVTEGT